ncbi:MAG TPA: hypothetical protein DCZ88_06845 [Pseudanabaena sp.]|nr:hypothetical protein [Pseudanabaena sp.]
MTLLTNYCYTYEYKYIDLSLKALWEPFLDLEAEINTFVPRPLTDYEEERRKKIKYYRDLNPSHTDEMITELADQDITFVALERVQFIDQFENRVMTHHIMVVLLSQALCEAAINTILTIGFTATNNNNCIGLLKTAKIQDKWNIFPKIISSSYEFQKGTGLDETLTYLINKRNEISHPKIDMQDQGIKLGKDTRIIIKEEIRWMKRLFSLPYDLSEYVELQLRDIASIKVFNDRSPILRAKEH